MNNSITASTGCSRSRISRKHIHSNKYEPNIKVNILLGLNKESIKIIEISKD